MNYVVKKTSLKISPRKLRLLAKGIKKMRPDVAWGKLQFTNSKAARILQRMILEVLGNAKNLSGKPKEDFVFDKIMVEAERVIKRIRPISRGSAHQIKKRRSKILLSLKEKNAKS